MEKAVLHRFPVPTQKLLHMAVQYKFIPLIQYSGFYRCHSLWEPSCINSTGARKNHSKQITDVKSPAAYTPLYVSGHPGAELHNPFLDGTKIFCFLMHFFIKNIAVKRRKET